MDNDYVLNLLNKEYYYTIDDLRYNNQLGINLSKSEFNDFLISKDQMVESGALYYDKNIFEEIPLKMFNSKHCFFVNGPYIKNLEDEYIQIMLSDYKLKQSSLIGRNIEDIILSKLFSEIEGTLQIENVPTTHKKIEEIVKKNIVTDKNDIIIKNMYDALMYILSEEPEFNEENLFYLYNMLSRDCLDAEDMLPTGCYYRNDAVSVGGFEGAPSEIIPECMQSLFSFANNKDNIQKYNLLLPYICQYYVLYIHPYFDYNGRTARMISFWLNYINKVEAAPYFTSEAINETKHEYYQALVNTRVCRNDMTYFLGYILEASIKYSFVYKNIEEIRNVLSKTGDSLTSAEQVYLKKIISHNPTDYFNYKMFLEYINTDMTKSGALKIINKLVDYNILTKEKNKKNEVIYKVNPAMIFCQYN